MATPAQVSRDSDFQDILETISETAFFVFHQAEAFCPYSSFSRLSFRMDAHRLEGRPVKATLHFGNLFEVDVKALGPKFDEVIKFILNCTSRPWPDPKFVDTEKSVMLEIASKIFGKLCDEVTMEKRYRSDIAAMPNVGLMTGFLGLGTAQTWHGTPDVRVRGVSICRAKGVDVDDEDSDSSTASDSTAVHIEGKINCIASNLPQAVATCVVSSFIEKSNHPDKSPLIPTILIDKKSFQIILFDCEKDILLISNAVSLSNNGRMSRTAIALLWIVLNHRLFHRGLPDNAANFPSTIRSRLESTGYLRHFASLKDKDLNWDSISVKYTLGGDDLPFGFTVPPPSKKPKTSK